MVIKDSLIPTIIDKIETKLGFFSSYPIISLIIIGCIGLFLRLIVLETEVPIRQDANAYFWYAMDMSVLKNIPESGHTNDGWPMLLSVFFSIFNYNNYLDLTILQRIITISISTISIIPLYLLCRKFFNPTYSIIGVALFTFEPHIIQNSVLGLSEPLYIFLAIWAYFLIFSTNQKLFFLSFAIISLATIVRAEAVINLLIITILVIIRNGKNKDTIKKILIGTGIFLLIFVPTMIIKTETSGSPSTALYITEFSVGSVYLEPERSGIHVDGFLKGLETLAKKLGQIMIPYFAIFVPFGLIIIFQNRDKNNILILIMLGIYILISIRMFMAVQDLRLILVLTPFFSIVSVYALQNISNNINTKRIFLILILGAVILVSWFFMYSSVNSEYEYETVRFAKFMVENVEVSNNFFPESGYVYGVWLMENIEFPTHSSDVEFNGPEMLDYVKDSFDYIELEAKSIEEYIVLSEGQGLSHLVVDGNERRAPYLNDLFYNEEKFPYLIKEFDSRDVGFKFYKVKVFKIDYDYFDELQK